MHACVSVCVCVYTYLKTFLPFTRKPLPIIKKIWAFSVCPTIDDNKKHLSLQKTQHLVRFPIHGRDHQMCWVGGSQSIISHSWPDVLINSPLVRDILAGTATHCRQSSKTLGMRTEEGAEVEPEKISSMVKAELNLLSFSSQCWNVNTSLLWQEKVSLFHLNVF